MVIQGKNEDLKVLIPRKDSMDASVKRSVPVVEAEQELGNIEYKRQVHPTTATRVRTLATQMSFRLDQGHGRCLYRIGVEDDGCHSLLSYDSVAESARVVECIARTLNAIVVERIMIQNEINSNNSYVLVVSEPCILGDAMGKTQTMDTTNQQQLNKMDGVYTRAELFIQRIETHLLDPTPVSAMDYIANYNPNNNATTTTASIEQQVPPQGTTIGNTSSPTTQLGETLATRNIRVAVVGNVDAGKSTLIGTLTTSCLDDGRGKSRTSIMKHRHEIASGRTSTATTHMMGFNGKGQPIAGKDQVRANKRKGDDEIARESHRIVTLMDLAGHEKYLKTTFGIPVIVVFTKIDGCPDHAYTQSKEQVSAMLRSPDVAKKPFSVRNEEDVVTVIDKLHTLAPMIETSCVTGEGMDLLQKMLFLLPKRRRHENKKNREFEFLVEDIFNVPGVGGVVSGFVNAGELTVGSTCNVFVGPTDDGTFMKTVAKSAHIARINTSHITAGQSACIAFALNKELRKKLRRGMVVLKENPTSTLQFDAEICVLKGEGTTIRSTYQAYVHILNVRQSAYAKHIEIVESHIVGLPPSHVEESDGIVLRPGSRAKVRFEFAKRPEYIRPGMRMLFRDGRVRGVGIITSIPQAQVVAA